VIGNPRASLELLPQQVDPVVDKHQRGPAEHLVPHDTTPEVHRMFELVFVIVPLIETVERSDEEHRVEAFKERCPSQFLNRRRHDLGPRTTRQQECNPTVERVESKEYMIHSVPSNLSVGGTTD